MRHTPYPDSTPGFHVVDSTLLLMFGLQLLCSRVTVQVPESARSTWIVSAFVDQPKTCQFGPKRGGVSK